MKRIVLTLAVITVTCSTFAQVKVAAIGSSTTAGLATSSPDSSWVARFNQYYKRSLGVLDTIYNLGVSSTNLYHGMPTSYTPPSGRPAPDPLHNVTRAVSLLSDLPLPTNGVVIINFPSGGYDTYTAAEILSALQILYDSATRLGNRAYVTTTQPRTDAGFNTAAIKRKLADLKDSIINRFGIARTINFWDGLYNPIDTTILPAYSAGDNVHFNNAGHRILFERVRAKNILDLPTVSYRSNVSPTGLWSDPNSWQVLNGSNWVTATIPPASGSGPITILNGDSIRINSYTELDQVTIESGAILALFNTNTPTEKVTIALNDGAGDDLVNNGRLYISANAILNGTGNVRNTAGGLFTLRNRGVLECNAVNEGNLVLLGTGIVRNRTVTNNRTTVLQDFTLQLIRSTFINNDSMVIIGGGATFIADSTLGGGFYQNTATGKLHRTQTTGSTTFSPSVTFSNSGVVKGVGEYIFNTVGTNTGSIAPGTSPGTLTLSPAMINGKTPQLNMEISGAGAVAGTNYDQLVLTSLGTTAKNVTGTRLVVTGTTTDPIGTTYTLVRTTTGTITGPFANVTLAPGLSGPFYNGTTITVTKTAALPLTWGLFTANATGSGVLLEWQTLQESNTASFEVEHASKGQPFTTIGVLPAAGESSVPVSYHYGHGAANFSLVNSYRIKQVDKDGRFTYSGVRIVQPGGTAPLITFSPNPVRDVLHVNINMNAQLVITDGKGLPAHTVRLAKGIHQLSVQHLPSGSYFLTVYTDNRQKETRQLIKW